MQPYKFPRSGGSLDLTSVADPPSPPQQEEPAPSHPSLLITDSSGFNSHPPEPTLNNEQYLAKFTSAAHSLLDASSSSSAEAPLPPSPAHLSAALPILPSAPKSLSRISEVSEYSMSAYSSGTRDSSSPSPLPETALAPSALPYSTSASSSRSASPAPSPIDPAFPSPPQPVFTFPQPPTHSGIAYPALPGSPKRHHLPSRPLTTPIPAANPTPVPVPIDNFAAPQGQERVPSPVEARASPFGNEREVMVQLPGRGPLAQQQPAYYGHSGKDSEGSSAWATAEDEKHGGYGGHSAGVFFPGDGYDSVSLAPSSTRTGSASHNRFTLDADERTPRRERAPAGGWEDEKRGSNRRVWIAFAILAIIGVAVGVGVGVGTKKAHETSEKAALADASSSPSSSLSGVSVLTPTPTSASFSSNHPASSSSGLSTATLAGATAAAAVQTYSRFTFARSGATTAVDLTYTIPSSYAVRADGRWQFTQAVELPAISRGASGEVSASFVSELRFRVEPTSTAAAATTTDTARAEVQKRAEVEAVERHREARVKRGRVIR
ncbi:hypothetical protein JCM10207_001631 [Rhodosporidiobolus poonsookiae]